MRLVIMILSLCSIIFSCCQETDKPIVSKLSKIDSLSTPSEIDAFLYSMNLVSFHFNVKRYADININSYRPIGWYEDITSSNEYQKIADSLGITNINKADFDRDGFTDLLLIGEDSIYGFTVLVILHDKDRKLYSKKLFTGRCVFPKVGLVNETPVINNNYFDFSMFEGVKADLKEETLIFNFNSFIEYNDNPTNHKIEKIKYSSSPCLGSCAEFTLIINQDQSATYSPESPIPNFANDTPEPEVKPTLKTSIDNTSYKELVTLINYLDFDQPRTKTRLVNTCGPTIQLKIYYDNGKLKYVSNLDETKGLDKLYRLLSQLRYSQKWDCFF